MRALVALALVLAAADASAQTLPAPGPGDPRLQIVTYDPDQVVQLAVSPGYQVMVAFAPAERVETIAVGDSTAWTATANKRGDALFVKNTGADRPSNMTVVTDARIYSFALTTGGSGEQPFIVRFVYAEAAKAADQAAQPAIAYRYRLHGAKALRPTDIRTDGRLTRITWAEKTALPATFRIDDDGGETLANGEMQGNALVIDGAPRTLVFRLGNRNSTATRERLRDRSR